jgi:hypothetical protein
MLGYHNCPPSLFESLDDEFDALWIRLARLNNRELMAALKEKRTAIILKGGVRKRSTGKRYK